jgi:hypothetical protein
MRRPSTEARDLPRHVPANASRNHHTAPNQAFYSSGPSVGLTVQRKCACAGTSGRSGECPECEAKKQSLHRNDNVQAEPGSGDSIARIPIMREKLSVGASNDPLEREADDMASRVVSSDQASPVGSPRLSSHAAGPASARSPQAQSDGAADGSPSFAPSSVDAALSSPGEPLSASARQFMEPRFGRDFSAVRVHTDRPAAESAQAIQARAYTAGTDIVFGPGEHAPGTDAGNRLLAHELAHVVQQTPAPASSETPIDRAGLDGPEPQPHPRATIVQRKTVQEDYSTAVQFGTEIGPLWNISLTITGAPEGAGQAFEDFRSACEDGISAAARAMGGSRPLEPRKFKVTIPYKSGRDPSDVSNDAYLLALRSAGVTFETKPNPTVQPAPAPPPAQPAPPAASAAGADFDSYIQQFSVLEAAAISDGFGPTNRITAFRKLSYDSAAAKTYAGAVVGGGVWNILIPGAAGTTLPPSWNTPALAAAKDYVAKHQVIPIAGQSVDVGHLLAGADAAKHPTSVSLAAGMVKLRSNTEATTFIGDLGSVVAEYVHGSKASFRDTAMVRSAVLDSYYTSFASAEDMAGNADAYSLSFDLSKALAENLKDYYAAKVGGVKKRYTSFAALIALGTLAGGRFTGDTAAWRAAMQEEVFNSALAYAGGKGWKSDVLNVFNDPGPGIFTPTFWEMYWNISQWVVDIFVDRIAKSAAAE